MDPFIDLLLLMAGLSCFYGVLGLTAGLAEKTVPVWGRVLRASWRTGKPVVKAWRPKE
jgi:hypothetical protein